MRNFFLCILIFFGSGGFHNALSYSDDLPKKPEELKLALETTSDDQVKLEIYWRLYKALKSTDKKAALENLDALEALAEELGEHEYSGKAHHGKALFHKRDGEYGKAISEYLVAIDHYTLSGSYTPLANDLNNIGVIFLDVEDYSYAIEFFQRAQEHYLETDNKFSAMITHMNLGTCFLERNRPDHSKAMEHFRKALDLNQANEKKQTYYFYKINNQLGSLLYRKGEFRKAIEHYRTSQRYVSTLNDSAEKEMILLMNMGEGRLTGSLKRLRPCCKKLLIRVNQQRSLVGKWWNATTSWESLNKGRTNTWKLSLFSSVALPLQIKAWLTHPCKRR